MDQSAFFGQLQSEAAARQSLADELLTILQGNGAVDPALEDARLYGGEEMNQLLFGRPDFVPVLIPATRFGVFRQLVSGRQRMAPASDPLRPFAPPPELPALPALPAPAPVEPPLDLEGFQVPEPLAPPALPPPEEDKAPMPADAVPELPEPAAAPAPPAALLLPPPSSKETPMSDLSQFANLSSPLSAPAAPTDSQDQIVIAKCLQKVSAILHTLMATRDTYSEAVADEMGIPPSVVDSLASGKGQDVTLGNAFRILLHLGAPNIALVVPAPRQPSGAAR